MASLTLGQALPIVDIGPRDWRVGTRRGDTRHRLDGKFKGSTLDQTLAMQRQFLGYEGRIVPMYYDFEDAWNGFYRVDSLDADMMYRNAALQNEGLLEFDFDLDFIGTDATTEFETPMTNILRFNSMDIISTEVNFWHSPGVVGDDTAYDIGNENSPGVITRTGTDGAVVVVVGIPDLNPKYRKSPTGFYNGGCYAEIGGYKVTGPRYHTNNPANFEIGNTLTRVTPETSGGVNTGGIVVSHYDGTAWQDKTYRFMYAGTTKVPEWHVTQINEVNAERVILQLIRDADEVPATTHRHTLELQIRRGSRFIEFRYYFSGETVDWKLERSTAETGFVVQPAAASSGTGIRASVDDPAGDRYVMGTGLTHTPDTTQGGITWTAVNEFTGFIGAEVGGSAAGTQDDAASLMLQYFGKSNVMPPSVVRAYQ